MEVVSVTSYFYTEDQLEPCKGEASLEYLRDVAQEAAEYLSAHRDLLGPRSYLEVLKRFPTWAEAADEDLPDGGWSERDDEEERLRESGGDKGGLRLLDEKITQALANMDYPAQWKNTDSQPREGNELDTGSVEALMHLCCGTFTCMHLQSGVCSAASWTTLRGQSSRTPLRSAENGKALKMSFKTSALRFVVVAVDPPKYCCLSS